MSKLTIIDVYKETEEIEVKCLGCEDEFIWSTINQEPDYCPMCGAKVDAAKFTNPERLEGE